MGGDQFQFKQFTIIQDRCAMKVGTDGVLLGAWTNPNGAKRILDIGTGTGLIALMLAQRSQAEIDAVEIDLAACLQAQENIARSPWFQRITVHPCRLQDYTPTDEQLYDLLVANPPFFTNVSKSVTSARMLARHDDQLTLSDLLESADRLLTKQGKLTVIYPFTAVDLFKKSVQIQGFFCNRTVWVKPTPYSPPKRVLMEISRRSFSYPDAEITIEKSRHIYTPEFIDLVREFYLKY